MSPEKVRERKQKRRYTFVIVPDAKSEKTRTFSVTRWGFIGVALASFLVIVALVFSTIVYTPVRMHLPISSPELVKHYGKQIIEIQKQLQSLVQEITVLRGYNMRLRKVMGERISGQDSAAIVTHGMDSLMMAAGHSASVEGQSYPSTFLPGNLVTPPGIIDEEFGFDRDARRRGMDFTSRLPLTMPVDGFVTREFDAEQSHYGIDFAGKQGSAVLASADGNVVFAGWTYENGFMMMLAHDKGYMTVYKHNESLAKNTGDDVKRGELIALLGNTGKTSSGPHLHFEVWKDGVAHDPNNYFLTRQ